MNVLYLNLNMKLKKVMRPGAKTKERAREMAEEGKKKEKRKGKKDPRSRGPKQGDERKWLESGIFPIKTGR